MCSQSYKTFLSWCNSLHQQYQWPSIELLLRDGSILVKSDCFVYRKSRPGVNVPGLAPVHLGCYLSQDKCIELKHCLVLIWDIFHGYTTKCDRLLKRCHMSTK